MSRRALDLEWLVAAINKISARCTFPFDNDDEVSFRVMDVTGNVITSGVADRKGMGLTFQPFDSRHHSEGQVKRLINRWYWGWG